MRKLLLSAMVLLLILSARAQIGRGSIFLGGDIGVYTQKVNYDSGSDLKGTIINVFPVFGKFIKDNLVVGTNLGFSLSNSENDLYIDNKITTYQAGVFIRKYKNIGASGFYIFGQGGLNIGYYKQESDAPDNAYDDEVKRTSISINAFPGISFAVSKRFHLETGFNNLVNLTYYDEKRDDNSPNVTGYDSHGFGISSSLSNATSSFYLGFRVLLSK